MITLLCRTIHPIPNKQNTPSYIGKKNLYPHAICIKLIVKKALDVVKNPKKITVLLTKGESVVLQKEQEKNN